MEFGDITIKGSIDGSSFASSIQNFSIADDLWVRPGYYRGDGSVHTIIEAPTFLAYVYKGITYLQVSIYNNDHAGMVNGKYLSVNRNGYLGIYSWAGASSFRIQGEHLVSCYNNQTIGIADGCWKADNGIKPIAFPRSLNGALYKALGA